MGSIVTNDRVEWTDISDKVMLTLLEGLETYFRMEVEGAHNLPEGQCIVYANHSGFSGLDGMLLSYSIRKQTGRLFKMVTHPFWFTNKYFEKLADRYGLIYASLPEIDKNIAQGESLIIFPEGEEGNFKESVNMYRLAPFRTGLVRAALQSRLPVVPATVIGAEESSINLGKIKIPGLAQGLQIPIPLNLIPFPAKWHITFHEVIDTTKYKAEYSLNANMVKKITRMWRKRLQIRLYRELKKRGSVF